MKLNYNNYSDISHEKWNRLNVEEKILFVSHHLSVSYQKNTDESWNSLKDQKVKRIIPNKYFLSISLKIAASIAIIVFITYLFGNVNIKSSDELVTTHLLPDQSVIKLTPNSSITYNKWIYAFKRKITLNGNASFYVTKGSNFFVLNPHIKLKVIGTSFDILSNEKYTKVICFTGKVEVQDKTTSAKTVIEGGEKVLIDKMEGNKKTQHFLPETALTNEKIQLKDVSVQKVFSVIEEIYSIKITYDQTLEGTFTGYLPTHNLSDALNTICISMNFNYILENNNYTIKRKTNLVKKSN